MRSHARLSLSIVIIAVLGAAAAVAQPDLSQSTATSQTQCIFICPEGDGQGLATILVTLHDSIGNPVVGYPAAQIWADAAVPGDLTYCETPFLADGPTDNLGQTTISGTVAGSGYTNQMFVYVGNSPLVTSPLDITVTSPDINGDKVIDLCDGNLLGIDFLGGYNYRSDFACDGVLNLSDILVFTNHFCHACATHSYGTIATSGEIGIFFDTAGTQSGVLGVPVNTFFNFYVVALSAPDGIAGYAFKVNVDPRILLVSHTLAGGIGLGIGGGIEDVVEGMGGNCLPALGPNVLADFQALLLSTDLRIPICLEASPSTCLPNATAPAYVICDRCEWRYFDQAYDGCAIVNGDGPVSVQAETWGTIKSLFNN